MLLREVGQPIHTRPVSEFAEERRKRMGCWAGLMLAPALDISKVSMTQAWMEMMLMLAGKSHLEQPFEVVYVPSWVSIGP